MSETALPLGDVVLVDLDDQGVPRELSRPLERRGLPVQRSRPGPSRARCERMDQQKPILLYLGGPRAAVAIDETGPTAGGNTSRKGKEEGVAPRAMQLPPNCPWQVRHPAFGLATRCQAGSGTAAPSGGWEGPWRPDRYQGTRLPLRLLTGRSSDKRSSAMNMRGRVLTPQ